MPGGQDYNRPRPSRRKSWQDPDELEGEPEQGSASPSGDHTPYGATQKRRLPRLAGGNNYDAQDLYTDADADLDADENAALAANKTNRNGGVRRGRSSGDGVGGDSDDNFAARKKKTSAKLADWGAESGSTGGAGPVKKKRKLLKLVGNEALCLLLIFAMIGAFNWMATDYSGDYMGRSPKLGQVRLSLTRKAASVEAELDYSRHGFLELVPEQANDPGAWQSALQNGKSFTLKFVEAENFHRPGVKPWKAVFSGHIDGGQASGTISDISGLYKVTLGKNVLTSIFRQTQDHIPQTPTIPLPSLFNEKDKTIRGVVR